MTKKAKMAIFITMNKTKIITQLLKSTLILSIVFCCCSKKQSPVETIDEKMLQEAIEYGKSKAGLSTYEFTEPWSVYLGYEVGKGRAVYVSQFLQAAQLAKNAAEKNLKPDINIIRKVVANKSKTLNFLVTTYGNEPDTSRRIKSYLIYNNKKIEPVYSHFPPFGEFNRDYYHQINGEVRFLSTDIPQNARVILCIEIVPPKEKREKQNSHDGHKHESQITVGKIPPENPVAEFVFDLSKYR